MQPCFRRGSFLLPNDSVNGRKWSVIACDQYTSQKEYWDKVEEITKDVPSTYHLIYPEIYLGETSNRIERIHLAMDRYLKENILKEKVKDGFVLVERKTISGNRIGVLGIVDLEAYDFTVGNTKPIRATEGTIRQRIPPRLKIRRNAPLELSHVMVLIDDPENTLIEELYKEKDHYSVLYDFDLMMDGGHDKGYAITGTKAQEIEEKIFAMQKERELFLAVGDGNHSLATAKACWEEIKKDLSLEQQKEHPARYAMVEMVNLHSPALIFEPIHRLLFQVELWDLYESFKDYCDEEGILLAPGKEIVFYQNGEEKSVSLIKKDNRLPVDILQTVIDRYLSSPQEGKIDYIHGEEAMMALLKEPSNGGIFLDRIEKSSLFPAIVAGGVLPRKTFSMGEADEKRFYLEARKVK